MKKVLTYSLIVGVLCLALLVQGQHSYYNSFALHKMTDAEIVRLGEYLADDSITIRLGGQEIEHHEPLDLETIRKYQLFSRTANVKEIHLLASGDYEKRNFASYYKALKGYGVSNRVTFKCEIWFDAQEPRMTPREWWNALWGGKNYQNRVLKYWRDFAKQYAKDANEFREYMAAHGEDVIVALNIPLPQNQNFKAFNSALIGLGFDIVDIHAYGKWKEVGGNDYVTKLDNWLSEIRAMGFDIFIGEHNGLANHHEGRELKNTSTHYILHDKMMDVYEKHGITEVYQFTLCANEEMMRWQNPMIYHRFLVTDSGVIDELDKVYE